MFQIIYFFGIVSHVGARIEILREMGIAFEESNNFILGNGQIEFDLEINHDIPTLEFGGGCKFEREELINIGESLGIDMEALKISSRDNSNTDLNKIITKSLVSKSLELTEEVRDRFLKTLPDKSRETVDISSVVKMRGIEQCDRLLVCEFTIDLVPQTCDFDKNVDECPITYICCDRYQRDRTKCPDKAYYELLKFLKVEGDMNRKTESGYCVHIVSARKSTARNRRSVIEYWKTGGLINVLTGGYSDHVIQIEELERQSADRKLENSIKENRNIMIKMNVQFNDLQMRLNEHVCKLTKNLMENLLFFEANVIFRETKMQIDAGMHSCWEGFLPLSVPMSKLTTICREILGESNEVCFYPYNLFKCENKGLWLDHNMIVHRVKVTFVKPVRDFTAIKIHVLPVPLTNHTNKYIELDTKSQIVFKNNKMGMFSFKKCEDRRIFSLCEIGSSNEILNDECMRGILTMNVSVVQNQCSTKVVNGNSCVYKILEGNIILSSHDLINIYRQSDHDIEFTKDKLLRQQKGLFVIENNNVNFQCGLINYQNVQLPKMAITESKIELKLGVTELPVKHTEILSDNRTEGSVFHIQVNNLSFVIGAIALIGVTVLTILKLRYIIKIKLKSWELIKLRKEFLKKPGYNIRREPDQRQSRRESLESVQID